MEKMENSRKRDVNAITQMSLENYPELTKPNWEDYIFQREIEDYIVQNFKERYTSYHNIVCFSHTPYGEAKLVRAKQKELIQRLASQVKNIDELRGMDLNILLDDLN